MPDDIQALKQEVWNHFKPMQTIGLATVENGLPRVRPVTAIHDDQQLFVATATKDNKVAQLRANPGIEFYFMVGDKESPGAVRAAGRAEIVEDPAMRKSAADRMPYFSTFWKTTDDPGYTLLRLHVESFEYMKPGTMDIKRFKA